MKRSTPSGNPTGKALPPEMRAARWDLINSNRAAGLKDSVTASQLGMSRDSLREWIAKDQAKNGIVREGKQARKCLRCWGMFASWGAGNRLCERCRYAATTDHPLLPAPGGHTGTRLMPRRP